MRTPSIAIITDSTCDLPPDVCFAAGIRVVPVAVTNDGAGSRTTQPSSEAFLSVLEEAVRDHDGAVVITHSAKLGGTIASARAAAERVSTGFPIAVIDSGSVTMGLGFAVLRAAEVAQGGGGLDEVVAAVDETRASTEVVFFVETLEYLEAGGRIGRAAALIGGALQLKPMLRIDEGQIVPFERARTRTRAIDDLAQFVTGLGKIERVAVLHASSPEEATVLANRLRQETGLKGDRVMVTQIGPAVAAHIGPGAMGVAVVDLPG